jgi:DNA-directed RNA polymerase specialized sigma24 family protein
MKRHAMLDLKDIPSITVTPAGEALAAKLVTETELLRLKVIAHLQARGLPPEFSWGDLLQEAFARILDGSRRRPPGLPMVNFVAGITRSIRSEIWARSRREAAQLPQLEHSDEEVLDPERSLAAVQELAAIQQLFEGDAQVSTIIAGLAEGKSAEQIRAAAGMTKTEYDSARKRMRRTLFREGLTWRIP